MICPFCETRNDAGETCIACGHPLVGATLVRRGSVIARRYEIKSLLGRGGMGMVYKAYDRVLEDVIALKVLRAEIAEDADLLRRFRQEMRLARRVRHRNVCAIHEYVEDGGLRCIAMECVEGIDLKRLLQQKGRFPAAEAFQLTIQIGEGLEAIHEAGIIHRDFKTSNIMRDTRGQVRLMDFGIAKEWNLDATSTGRILGTPEYLSPEQATGAMIDFRSDIYAFGIVVFEIFTGEVPFRSDTPLATILKQCQDPPPLDDPKIAGLPSTLLPVLRTALAKDPAERFQTVREMIVSLQASSADALGAATPTPTTPIPFPRTVPQPADARVSTGAISLGGDLKSMGLPTILRWVASGQKTGTLVFESQSVQKKLFFRRGAICSSWSNDPRESLGQFLVCDGRITEEQLFNALLKQEQQGRLLGAILIADGLITPEGLIDSMRAKAEETIYELFLWSEGRFQFTEGDGAPSGSLDLSIAVPEIIEEGTRRREDWLRIRQTIPSGRVSFRLRDPGQEMEDPRANLVLDLAAAGKTLEEISLETRLGEFAAASYLENLCARGILEVDHVDESVPTVETLDAIRELLEMAQKCLEDGRFDAALEAYEGVLSLDPLNQYAKKGLITVVESRHRRRAKKAIPLNKTPILKVPLASLTLASIDPQEGFILSRINGQWDVQSILKLCPMSEDDALLAMARLLSRKIIDLK
ncbi:MAG: protein kinase [Vicinamibacteria bacterium]|nr:protein kinase [Vicinamibacteria bacterium]